MSDPCLSARRGKGGRLWQTAAAAWPGEMGVDQTDLLKQLRIGRDQRDEESSRVPWPWAVAVVIAIGVLAGGAWMLLGTRSVAVEVVTAEAPVAGSETGAVLQATGYVTARRKATVSAQITGRLTEVHIEEGERVVRGQLLARLDDAQARAALDLARAQLAAAQAAVAQSRAQAVLARQTLVRQRDLVGRGLTPRQSYDQAQSGADGADAALLGAERQVQVARAQLDEARVNYDYTFVRAPFAGVIVDKAAQVGEIVSPFSAGGGFTRTGVATIVDMNSLEVDVDVNEAYIARIRPDQPAEAVLDAYPDWKIPAHVIAIVPTADKSKATVKVRVALESKDPRILPDMGVRVSFLEQAPKVGSAAPKGALVPATALVKRDGGDAVFVVAAARARLTPVTAGPGYGDLRLITSGLAVGARVVVKPPANLADGAHVKAAEAPE